MTDALFVFRFRDLVAPTLKEHRKVISEHGKCWWGWWKRPNESSQLEVWESLASSSSDPTPTRILLFDSGNDKAFFAKVVGVIPPLDADSSQLRPEVPKDELVLVPSYYRTSPFSQAWLKLVEIDKKPSNLFGDYSFATAPKLPKYRASVTKKLENKVVVTADELKGMDTTIWHVRPKLETDHDDEFVWTSQGLPSPIESQSIDTASDTILHITDLHFATDRFRTQHVWRLESEDRDENPVNSLAEAIESALKLEKRTIGMVIVTGDLTFTGSPEEYKQARLSLVRLVGILGIDQDQVVIVPGNHDIPWTQDKSFEHGDTARPAPRKATKNFRNFYKLFYRHEANHHLSMGRCFRLPLGVSVELCAVNSSSLEHGKDFLSGMGKVNEAAVEDVANALKWSDRESLALRVLALHHHLAQTDDLEMEDYYARGFGIAVDAPRIQRLAVRRGVQLALHGHKHRAFLWRSNVYDALDDSQEDYDLGALSIIGGGSAGSSANETGNYFNLVRVRPSGLELKVFRSKNRGAFGPMQTWNADFALDANAKGLLLSKWKRSSG